MWLCVRVWGGCGHGGADAIACVVQDMSEFHHLHGGFDVPSAAMGVWDAHTCELLGDDDGQDSGSSVTLLLPLSSTGDYTLFTHLSTAGGDIVVTAFHVLVGGAAAHAASSDTPQDGQCPAVALEDVLDSLEAAAAGDPVGMGRMQPPGVVVPPSEWDALEWDLELSPWFSWRTPLPDSSVRPPPGTVVVDVYATPLAACRSLAWDHARAACVADKLLHGAAAGAGAVHTRALVCAAQAVVADGAIGSCHGVAREMGIAAFGGALGAQRASLDGRVAADDDTTASMWVGAQPDIESALRQAMESCMGELTQGGDGDHPRVEPCGGGCVQGAVAAYALQLQVDDRSRLARVCDMLAEDSLAMWMSCVQGACSQWSGRV